MNLIPREFYLDDFFDNFMDEGKKHHPLHPHHLKCDIYEKDGVYNIEMDAPGFKKEDINIEVNDGNLTISVKNEKNTEEKDENKKYIRRERCFGKYERSFYLGDVDEDNIKASFNNGVLKLTIPKKEVIDTKKTIEIE